MTPDVVTAAVLSYVREQWNAATFSLPWPSAETPSTATPTLTIETTKHEPPPDGEMLVRALVRHGDSKQRTLGPVGSQRWQTQATLEVQIWAPPGDDTDSVMAALIAKCKALFEGRKAATGLSPFRGMRKRVDAVNGRIAFSVRDFPFEYRETK